MDPKRVGEMQPRGRVSNIWKVYLEATPWERQDGHAYYDEQRWRMQSRTRPGITLEMVTAAFCALSPNSSESGNYHALDTCIDIATGGLPPDSKVRAYGTNTAKALRILRGEYILDVLSGLKVTSFYYNTIDPDDSRHVTIDGHMLSVWVGQRLVLKREAEIRSQEYPAICNDYRQAAKDADTSAPRFQATVWLTWKRLNRILYNPQLKFDYGNQHVGIRL